jgi:hypothetical protein
MKLDTLSRIVGSILIVVSYFVILHVNVTTGTVMYAVADIMSIPYFIRTTAWDVVIMMTFMTCISISKFASAIF